MDKEALKKGIVEAGFEIVGERYCRDNLIAFMSDKQYGWILLKENEAILHGPFKRITGILDDPKYWMDTLRLGL